MKMYSLYFIALCLLLVCHTSCEDDDICIENTTPSLIVVFKDVSTQTNTTLNTVFVDIETNGNLTEKIVSQTLTDSISIPLPIENSTETILSLYYSEGGNKDKVQLTYENKDVYISKSCGFKKTFINVSANLIQTNQVQQIELLTDEISNQNQTHLTVFY